jgi:hypothetical protein
MTVEEVFSDFCHPGARVLRIAIDVRFRSTGPYSLTAFRQLLRSVFEPRHRKDGVKGNKNGGWHSRAALSRGKGRLYGNYPSDSTSVRAFPAVFV